MIRLIVIVIAFVAIESQAQLSNVSGLWKEAENKADDLYSKNLYSKALEQYLLSIDKGNKDPIIYLKAGRSYFKLRNFSRAAEFLELPIENAVGDPVYRNEDVRFYAESLLATGNIFSARNMFEEYYRLTGDESILPRMAGIKKWEEFFVDEQEISVKLLDLSTRDADIGLSKDSDGLIFSSKGDFSWPVDNDYLMGDIETFGLFFAAKKRDSLIYSRPKPIEINRNYYNITSPAFQGDSLVVFSAGRTTIFIFNTEKDKNLKLYRAKIAGKNDWRFPKKMEINIPGSSMLSPMISPSGDSLFFASNTKSGSGGFDLYLSIFRRGHWNTPENLGPEINTSGDEVYPFYKNGKLFFSSNGHGGLGGLDIFYTDLMNVNIKNFGSPVNSPLDDFNLILEPGFDNKGYFISNRPDGPGKDDIYTFISNRREKAVFELLVETNFRKTPLESVSVLLVNNGDTLLTKTDVKGMAETRVNLTDTLVLSLSKEPFFPVKDTFIVSEGRSTKIVQMDQEYILKGIVQSAENFQSVPGPNIFTTDLHTGVHSDFKGNQNGYFEMKAVAGSEISFEISAEGFDYSVDTVLFDLEVVTKNFTLERIEKFETITLSDILYNFDQYKLSKDQIPTLDSLAMIMKRMPTVHILVVSHTDSKGDSRYNFDLSQKRAESVSGYLMNQGIARSRILSEGRGESEPLNKCVDGVACTEEEYRVNRRTEVNIYYDKASN